jgi:hypothetical protein
MRLRWAGFRSWRGFVTVGPFLKTFDARPMETVLRNHTKGGGSEAIGQSIGDTRGLANSTTQVRRIALSTVSVAAVSFVFGVFR